MSKKWDPNAIRLLNLGPTASWRTQAVYHATAEMMTAESPDTIIICQPLTPYLCLGFHQVYSAVLDQEACERLNLPVVRRQLDGETIYFDVNQLCFQCVFHHSRVPIEPEEFFSLMLAGPVATLRRLGLNAKLTALNEIEVNEKRVTEIAVGRIAEASVITGNILFDFDYKTMTQVWRAPNDCFRDLASAALRENVTTIWRETGPITTEAVLWVLLDEFAKALERPIVRGTPKQAETRHAREIAERMTSTEFLASHSKNGQPHPMNSLKISGETTIQSGEGSENGRHIQASFRVRNGIIEEACIQSDPGQDWVQVEARLKGILYHEWQRHLEKR